MTTELGPESRLRVSSSVYARPFDDELVLLEFSRGEYFALDEVGAVVWRSLEAGSALSAAARAVASAYDVSEETALADILALVRELRARALVEPL